MEKMLMKKPGKIANTFVSAEVMNDPKAIANWERRGYKQAGIVYDSMQRPELALKREGGLLSTMQEDDLGAINAAAAAKAARKNAQKADKPQGDTPIDGVLEDLGQDVIDALKAEGLDTVEKLKGKSQRDLVKLDDIGRAKAKRIVGLIAKA